MISERRVLELLVERLQPRLEDRDASLLCAWEAEAEEQNKAAAGGKLHFAEAVETARKALRSGDQQKMKEAALLCASLERTGNEVEQRSRKKLGGRARGASQSAAAQALWGPYVQQYETLLATGLDCSKARRSVTSKMAKDGFVMPGGGFPNERTIRIWLPASKKK